MNSTCTMCERCSEKGNGSSNCNIKTSTSQQECAGGEFKLDDGPGTSDAIHQIISNVDIQSTSEQDSSECHSDPEENDNDSSGSFQSSGWSRIPCTVMEKIFHSMSYCERLNTSSVCKKWRQCLYTPRLWWNIDLYVTTKREGKKAFFLTKCIHFAKTIRIHWPAVYDKGTVHRPRPLDLHNKETLKALFSAMRQCQNLHQLVLKLENPCAYSIDFSRPVQHDLGVVCHKNPKLTQLSFGCNSTITPPCVVDLMLNVTRQKIEELHVARFKPSFCNNPHEAVPVLSSNDFNMFSQLTCIKELSLDWANVSPGVIRGLTNRSGNVALQKLNLIVASHLCSPSSHPSEKDWSEFGDEHTDVHITLTFIQHFRGICDSLRHIKPRVFFLKIAECSYIQPELFGDLVSWHGDNLHGLAHVAVWKNIELEIGAALWPYVVQCRNLKHLTFLGHFLLDEVVLFIASHFRLDSLVVSKAHVMTFSEVTPYLIQATATKYNHFKQEIGALLQRPWEALSRTPFEGHYFAEGKDDTLYFADH